MKKNLIYIAENTLNILENKTWDKISVNEIKLKVKIKNFDHEIDTKIDLLININKYIDFILSKKLKDIESSSKKDMIFEILMSRFDILQKNRKSIVSIFKSFKIYPQNFIFLLPSFVDSMTLIANYANIPLKGISGRMKIKGILIVYFSTFLIWIKDDSESLEKTMISLDQYLIKAEKFIKLIKK